MCSCDAFGITFLPLAIKYLEKIKRERKEYEIYAEENGLEVDEIQDATVEETTHDHEKEQ